MKRITRLTERDLTRIIKRVISEQTQINCACPELKAFMADGLEKAKGATLKGSWEMIDVDTVKFDLPFGTGTLTLNVTD
jgi:hypothetical protein